MVSVFCSVVIGLQTFKVRGRVRNVLMITVRNPGSIHQVDVPIDGGSCHGRWHFSFDRYYDPEWVRFGTLRVFNDDTLTPGAVWPLHPHREIEVVTYCASGEFRHADENGEGGVLKEGWVQHTTVGEGMWHSRSTTARMRQCGSSRCGSCRRLRASNRPSSRRRWRKRIGPTGSCRSSRTRTERA